MTRYENVDNEMDTLRKEVDRLKSENLSVCMRLIESNEESSKLRKINMSLENENDKTRADLQKVLVFRICRIHYTPLGNSFNLFVFYFRWKVALSLREHSQFA